MKVKVTAEETFLAALKRLPPQRQKGAIRALTKFQVQPALPSLDFRPLSGASGYFIIDPHSGDRIILCKNAENDYSAVDVGPHDNVYRRWNR